METQEALKRKIHSASDLANIVHTMKAMAAAAISQYENAANSLQQYHTVVQDGIKALSYSFHLPAITSSKKDTSLLIVLGSDQGLVGQYNESITSYAIEFSKKMRNACDFITVGAQVNDRMQAQGKKCIRAYNTPTSLSSITPLVTELLNAIYTYNNNSSDAEYENQRSSFIIYHQKNSQGGYQPAHCQLFPLTEAWSAQALATKWPTNSYPVCQGIPNDTLSGLVTEYIFVTIFKACTDALTSENACRLEAMQRAEKNINEMSHDLNQRYNWMRQAAIDEELFDILAAYITT